MPKKTSSLSLPDAVNLLTYSYDTPYSLRQQIYSQILSSYSFDLLRPNLSSLSTGSPNIFDFSDLSFSTLTGSGFQYLPSLSPSFTQELLTFATDNLQDIPNSPKSQVPAKALHGSTPLLRLFCSRQIIDPIALYLNIIPSIQYISLWRTEPSSDYSRTSEMHWHMDHHGHKFVKVFFYLTDVQFGDGHHEFILNSHCQTYFDSYLDKNFPQLLKTIALKRKLRGKFHLPDDLLLPILDRRLSLVGSRGTGFMEDTRGLHRGTPIISDRPRIILQALFVPFDSMKDPIDKVSISPDIVSKIRSYNSYTQSEVSKILSIIT